MTCFSHINQRSSIFLFIIITISLVGMVTYARSSQIKPAEQAEISIELQRKWLEIQHSPEIGSGNKIKATLDTFLHVYYESLLSRDLKDFGFLFDKNSHQAMEDYTYERGLLSVFVARWKDYGITPIKYEYEPRYRTREEGEGRVRIDAYARAVFTFEDEPDKTDTAPSEPTYKMKLAKLQGCWLIQGIRCDSPQHNLHPRGSDFEEIAANLPSEIEFSETESEFLHGIKKELARGNPRMKQRWEQMITRYETDDLIMSLQDIKRHFRFRKIIRMIRFDRRFVLVESYYPRSANWYYFFDLGTGERQILPTGIFYASLYKIRSEASFIFNADGRNHVNHEIDVPFIIECERMEPGEKIHMERRTRYFPLESEIEFGGKSKEVIKDARITIHGIQIAFGPQPGHEGNFYAGYSDIPVTRTKYDKKRQKLIIFFVDTLLPSDRESLIRNLNQTNSHISQVELKQAGSECHVALTLKQHVKFYTAYKNIAEGPPYVEFRFHVEDKNIDIR